jgi:MSHA biogenesis protein MshK
MVGTMKWMALVLLAMATSAGAQSADPTRPPAAWLTAADTGQADAVVDGGLRLQSVLVKQSGKPVAVIGGKTVVLGERLGEATLVRLNEREAVLKGADGVTHLYLTPEVEKRMVVTPASGKTGKAGSMKGLP